MQISAALRDAAGQTFMDELNTALGGAGTLDFLDGTMPGQCEDPDDGFVVASCALDSPAWDVFVSGVANANPISDSAGATAGTVSYWRFKDSGGVVAMQGTAGESSEEFVFDESTFANGDIARVNSFTLGIVFV